MSAAQNCYLADWLCCRGQERYGLDPRSGVWEDRKDRGVTNRTCAQGSDSFEPSCHTGCSKSEEWKCWQCYGVGGERGACHGLNQSSAQR